MCQAWRKGGRRRGKESIKEGGREEEGEEGKERRKEGGIELEGREEH